MSGTASGHGNSEPTIATDLDQVGVGCHVEVELVDGVGNRESMAFDLVQPDAADLDQGFLSVESPLGRAIRGKRRGATIAYRMGDVEQVHIVRIARAAQEPPADAAARRRQVLDEARRKAERTNAEMFAASYGSKWGDYDVSDQSDPDDTGEDATPSDGGGGAA